MKSMNGQTKIVVLGGGTGTYTVLTGLRDYPVHVTAIVATADDGGSTGILRDELGVLPPGDIRQALVALSREREVVRELMSYRFTDGSLQGHAFGNLFLSALEKVTGTFPAAVAEASRLLSVQGEVLPVTTTPVKLRAEMTNGQQIFGEHAVEQEIWTAHSLIHRLWLEPNAQITDEARKAIQKADCIVIAPGSIFTSLIPNLLVQGVSEAIRKAKAPVVYVANLMTEKGHTGSFSVHDYAALIEQYLGEGQLDYVVCNTAVPPAALLDLYKKEMERVPVLVKGERAGSSRYSVIGGNLLGKAARKCGSQDPLAAQRTLIRHDSKKLAACLYALAAARSIRPILSKLTRHA